MKNLICAGFLLVTLWAEAGVVSPPPPSPIPVSDPVSVNASETYEWYGRSPSTNRPACFANTTGGTTASANDSILRLGCAPLTAINPFPDPDSCQASLKTGLDFVNKNLTSDFDAMLKLAQQYCEPQSFSVTANTLDTQTCYGQGAYNVAVGLSPYTACVQNSFASIPPPNNKPGPTDLQFQSVACVPQNGLWVMQVTANIWGDPKSIVTFNLASVFNNKNEQGTCK